MNWFPQTFSSSSTADDDDDAVVHNLEICVGNQCLRKGLISHPIGRKIVVIDCR